MVGEFLGQLLRLLVVQLSIAVELLVQPLAIICWIVLLVVQSPLPTYFIAVEVTLVISPVVVYEFSVPLF